jgi:hypothetical protein
VPVRTIQEALYDLKASYDVWLPHGFAQYQSSRVSFHSRCFTLSHHKRPVVCSRLATMAAVQDPLAPLIDLVNRLRGELDEDVLEAKRRRLALAEATLELLLSQRQKETEAAPTSEEGGSGVKGASEAGARGSEDEGDMAPDQPIAHTQASGRCCKGCPYLAM